MCLGFLTVPQLIFLSLWIFSQAVFGKVVKCDEVDGAVVIKGLPGDQGAGVDLSSATGAEHCAATGERGEVFDADAHSPDDRAARRLPLQLHNVRKHGQNLRPGLDTQIFTLLYLVGPQLFRSRSWPKLLNSP
jgi:hypothetical protein